jgi:hypothetical protein
MGTHRGGKQTETGGVAQGQHHPRKLNHVGTVYCRITGVDQSRYGWVAQGPWYFRHLNQGEGNQQKTGRVSQLSITSCEWIAAYCGSLEDHADTSLGMRMYIMDPGPT